MDQFLFLLKQRDILIGPLPSKPGHPKLLREVVHVALARHQILTHPAEPFRFAQIVSIATRVSEDFGAEKIVKFFFENDQHSVLQFIHSILFI